MPRISSKPFITLTKTIPIIATGHLYAAGAAVSSTDDGMRDIQIGTLGQISSQIFDDAIDYVALGHIHAAQKLVKTTSATAARQLRWDLGKLDAINKC